MTRTCVAQVVSLACEHQIPCVISMRSCFVFHSLRYFHFPLFAVHLLSYRPVFPPGHQFHLPRCGGQIPCSLQDFGTLAEYDPLTIGLYFLRARQANERRLRNFPRSRQGRGGVAGVRELCWVCPFRAYG